MKVKVKFVSYKRFNELLKQNPGSELEHGLLINGVMYRYAGGDDWRKVDINEYCFRGSCDTANGFIYNDKTKEFALVDPYLYDQLVCSTERPARFVMSSAFNSAKYKGTFTKFELFKNKAAGMVLTINED